MSNNVKEKLVIFWYFLNIKSGFPKMPRRWRALQNLVGDFRLYESKWAPKNWESRINKTVTIILHSNKNLVLMLHCSLYPRHTFYFRGNNGKTS